MLAEKTKGNLTEAEDRTLQTVLFEVRMAFLELTSMITMQAQSCTPRAWQLSVPAAHALATRSPKPLETNGGTAHISRDGDLDGGSDAGVRVRGVHVGRSARPAAAAFGAGALA